MKTKLIAVGLATVFTLSVAGPARAGGWHGRRHASHHSDSNDLALALGITGAIIGTAILADALTAPRYAAPAPEYYAPSTYYAPPVYAAPPAYYPPPPVYYAPRVAYAVPVYHAPRAYYAPPRHHHHRDYRPAYRPSPDSYRGGPHGGRSEGRTYQPADRGDHRPASYASEPRHRHSR